MFLNIYNQKKEKLIVLVNEIKCMSCFLFSNFIFQKVYYDILLLLCTTNKN